MSRKLYDRLNAEKFALSYADLHHEITKSMENSTLKSCRNYQKQEKCSRTNEEDELVKYMSNLPGYLERGENIQEKVLNVGVLDWTRLEQWQYSHKPIPYRSSRSSTSTSNTFSSVSTDGLSGRSSRGHSWSPFHRTIRRPSLQSHFMTSPMLGQDQGVKSSGERVGNYQNLRDSHSNISAQSKFVRADEHLCQNLPDSRMEACNKRNLDSNIDLKSVSLPDDQICQAASCAKLEMSTQVAELERRGETLQDFSRDTVEQWVLRKSKQVVFLSPRDMPLNRQSEVSDTRTVLGEKLGNPSGVSFKDKPKELSFKDSNYRSSHSCPLSYDVYCESSEAKGSNSVDSESTKTPAATFSAPVFAKLRILSPSRSIKPEERKQTIATTSSASGTSQGLDQKVTCQKSRSASPFRRFSISMGYLSKSSGCKEGVHVPHQSSAAAAKINSDNARGSGSSDVSGSGKPGGAGRSRSSPLRRLLDPLLKPKAANCRQFMDSYQKDTVLINKHCRSANGNSTLQLEKNSDRDHRVGCSTIHTDKLLKDKNHASTTIQALLRITVKNGLPLFTFAVENNTNILAATVKKLSTSRKDDNSCIYTFFTFREVKKKNGSWMNQAGKSKGSDYIHHVVAQMTVSDSHFHDLPGYNRGDYSTVKEYVLFSVKVRQRDGQATDYQPNDELAAIIVKIPKAISFINDVHQSSCHYDSQHLVHASVVLPSGIHSLPSKGGPSSLIERWKSGGSCDCGGWDLGCELKILANEDHACRKSKSSEAYLVDQFELYIQGTGKEHRPAFSLVPFKQGIYSVAFDSSLSLLPAFSTCIALVDGKMPSELFASRNSVEGKILPVQSDKMKAFNKLEDISASFVSCPPLSPVGRV